MIPRTLRHILLLLTVLYCSAGAVAATNDNDMVLNRLYADRKPLHFGFSVGMNFQDLAVTNNGYITDDGEQWWADVPSHSPGFCVNVLADLRLSTYLNLRLTPGMYFGNKVVQFRNSLGDPSNPDVTHLRQSQNIKCTYVVVPLDLTVSSLRYHNMRPYFTGGAMAVFNVGKDRSEQLKLKTTDVMLSIGMGCDFYLPFFKLCPEVKFCFGLKNILQRDRPDLDENPEMMRFTQSVDKVQNKMVVLTFYFE